MPISSKKTMEYIRSNPGRSFTVAVIRELHAAHAKKKKQPPLTDADIRIIEATLAALAGAGLLVAKRGKYVLAGSLDFNAPLEDESRTAYRVYCNGVPVIIRRELARNAAPGDEVRAELLDLKKGVFYARVKKVTRKLKPVRYGIVEKCEGRFAEIKIPSADEPLLCRARTDRRLREGTLVQLEMSGQRLGGKPECIIIAEIDESDESHDFPRIVSNHSLPGPFDAAIEQTDFAALVSPAEMRHRKDFRDLFTVTIDGDTAKDFDDALSLEKTRTGMKLYVHIADVSAYVTPRSRIDTEARRRGTSYYLGNRVIPMLPEGLSNELCSLKENTDRLALTAVLTYAKNGELKDAAFTRSVIRVDKRLTYRIAHEVLTENRSHPHYQFLLDLKTLADTVKQKRLARGRIDLNLTDSELVYHEGTFTDVAFSDRYLSHSIIEECMLSANEAVAKALREADMPALYRVHEKMSDENVISLARFLRSISMGISQSTATPLGVNIQKVVERVAGLPQEKVINYVILRSMMQAFYGPAPEGHFGLGFEDYTHFTSPIRRYPDLIVHRCLKALIDQHEPPYPIAELGAIGEESSRLERTAQRAERDLFKLKSARVMKRFPGEEFDGIISGISRHGLYVILKERPVEGMIPFRNMADDFYDVNEETHTATGRRTGRTFSLGDALTVRVTRADVVYMQIDFELAGATLPKQHARTTGKQSGVNAKKPYRNQSRNPRRKR